MSEACDVVVAGLGAMGSAAVDHLARAGLDVVGLDPRRPPHGESSHHGYTRVIRKAYFEHPTYVDWVQRAYELWGELEEDTGRKLYTQTGGLHVSTPEGRQARGARYAAEAHDLTAEALTSRKLAERFPAFKPSPRMEAVYSPDSGFLQARECIRAQLERAREGGARLLVGEPLAGWDEEGEGVRVHTPERTLSAQRLVLAVGPWLPEVAPELPVPLEVERQVQFIFEPERNPERFEPGAFPVFACDGTKGEVFYGVPVPGKGVKVAAHHGGETTTPASLDRGVRDSDEEKVRAFLHRTIPDLDGSIQEAMVCMYTNTPDRHFLLDPHPGHEDVVVVSACSGHGFKFAPAIGEAIRDLVLDGEARQERALFRMGRFEPSSST